MEELITRSSEDTPNNSHNTLSKWTNILITAATFVTAAAAIVQCLVYKGQLHIMQSEHQPSVGLSGIGDVQNSTAITVSIQNGGKSPAIRTSVGIRSQPFGLAPAHGFNGPCTDDCRIREFLLSPGIPMSFRVPKMEDLQITLGDTTRVIIRIDYWDDAGVSHNVGICFLKAPHDIGPCPEKDLNYVDKK